MVVWLSRVRLSQKVIVEVCLKEARLSLNDCGGLAERDWIMTKGDCEVLAERG